MEEEQEILIEEKASLWLEFTDKNDIARVLKLAAGFFLGGFVGGVIVDDRETQKRHERISSLGDASEEDFATLIGMEQRGKLILTSNHFVLLFQTGFRKKKDQQICIPLKFAKSVEKASLGVFGQRKMLLMKFELPAEEKPIRLDLRIFVKNREQWLTELTRLIQ